MRLSRRDVLKLGLTVGLTSPLCCRSKTARPHVLLVTLDTTRADHLGAYGYRGDTSPFTSMSSRRTLSFTLAPSPPSSWTLPSHASLFTGKFPASHRARYDPEGPLRLTDAIVGPAAWTQYRARGLSENEVTLASLLKALGYRTGAVVAGPWMKRIFGLATGFDYYDDDQIGTVNGRLAEDVTSTALRWSERTAGAPFFLALRQNLWERKPLA